MPEPGYIYILMNASMPKLLKIGKTTKPPERRADELSVSTGVPTPYHVAYQVYVNDCDSVERQIHDRLTAYRINDKREFFSAPLKLTIQLLSEFETSMETTLDETSKTSPTKATLSQNEARKMLELGQRFQEGLGVRKDNIEAYVWYLLAKQFGAKEVETKIEELDKVLDYTDKILALNTAAFYLKNGRNLPVLERDAELFFSAVSRGELCSLTELGLRFEEGRNVDQNYTLALRCYIRAAKDGILSVYQKLAEMYENGVGVPSDIEKAYAFYSLADKAGAEEVKESLKKIEASLPKNRVVNAKKFAMDFEHST